MVLHDDGDDDDVVAAIVGRKLELARLRRDRKAGDDLECTSLDDAAIFTGAQERKAMMHDRDLMIAIVVASCGCDRPRTSLFVVRGPGPDS